MTLEYKKDNSVVREIEGRLKELSLAFDKKLVKTLQSPVLVDGSARYKGEKAILEHLLLLEGELQSWYYCDC